MPADFDNCAICQKEIEYFQAWTHNRKGELVHSYCLQQRGERGQPGPPPRFRPRCAFHDHRAPVTRKWSNEWKMHFELCQECADNWTGGPSRQEATTA